MLICNLKSKISETNAVKNSAFTFCRVYKIAEWFSCQKTLSPALSKLTTIEALLSF